MLRLSIFLTFMVFITSPALAADSMVSGECRKIEAFKATDCQNEALVRKAIGNLHACVKSRFKYEKHIYGESWPTVTIPETGAIVGGDGEWSVACMEQWPCKDKRLAFVQTKVGEIHLAMVSGTFVVDYSLDKVYTYSQIEQKGYRILKVSGLKKDEPWYRVDE